MRKVLLGRSLLLSGSSILEGVQLGLKQDVLVLECPKLALEGSHLVHDFLDGWDVWISHGRSRRQLRGFKLRVFESIVGVEYKKLNLTSKLSRATASFL